MFAPIGQSFLVLGVRRKGREGQIKMVPKGTRSGLQTVQEPTGAHARWKSKCGTGSHETCTFALSFFLETLVQVSMFFSTIQEFYN